MGVRVSQVKLSNFQVPQKISFTFHFWHKNFILGDMKLAELSNSSFEWKNVTFKGGVNTDSDPSYIFSVVKTPSNPFIYIPAANHILLKTRRQYRCLAAASTSANLHNYRKSSNIMHTFFYQTELVKVGGAIIHRSII